MKTPGGPPYVCLITEGKSNPENYQSEKLKLLDTAREAVEDGVNLIQIREKELPARLLFELVNATVKLVEGSDALVIVNERVDIAIAAGAGGVHLPQSSLPPSIVCERFRDELVIGVSTHSYLEAKAAAHAKADYILFGPVFPSPGKGEPVGVDALKEVCVGLEGFPVIALGGIDENNFEQTLTAGAAGIAAIRALNDHRSRRAICGRLHARLKPTVR